MFEGYIIFECGKVESPHVGIEPRRNVISSQKTRAIAFSETISRYLSTIATSTLLNWTSENIIDEKK